MVTRRYGLTVLTLTALAVVVQPAWAQKKPKGVYVDPGVITDSSNKYTDTDLRLLTSRMVESMITSTFHAPAEGTPSADRPIIAMGRLENRTTQDIDVKLILETIQTNVLKSKAARFVNRDEAFKGKMAEEMALNQVMGDPGADRKLIGYQYLLEGSIIEIPSENNKTRYYKLTLTLTDIRSSEKVWAEEQDLKKQRK